MAGVKDTGATGLCVPRLYEERQLTKSVLILEVSRKSDGRFNPEGLQRAR